MRRLRSVSVAVSRPVMAINPLEENNGSALRASCRTFAPSPYMPTSPTRTWQVAVFVLLREGCDGSKSFSVAVMIFNPPLAREVSVQSKYGSASGKYEGWEAGAKPPLSE